MQRTGLIQFSIHYMITEREKERERERDYNLPSSTLHHPFPTNLYSYNSYTSHFVILIKKVYHIRDDVSNLDSEVLAVSTPVARISPLLFKMLISSFSKSSL